MRRTLRIAALVLLNTLVILLVFEVLARAILWHSPARSNPSPAGFGFSAGGYGDLLPNLDTGERLMPTRPYHLQTNSVGLRNTDELREDAFRILAVGDSFVYGMYVHNRETFPARLEEVLNQRLETRVQVLNAGVPGYTIADELEYLYQKGLALKPNLVILGFYTNDIFDFYPVMREYFSRSVVLGFASSPAQPASTLQIFLRDNLAVYNLWLHLRGQYEQRQIEAEVNRVTPTVPGLHRAYQDLTFLKPDAPEFAGEWQAYESALRETLALLAERGIPAAMVAWPDLSQIPRDGGLPDAPQRMLARVTAETDTPFLDLLPVYRAAGDIPTLYLMYYDPDAPADPTAPDAAVLRYRGDGHPSAYGHQVAAQAMAELLIQNGLVPQ
ncbi:MAG: hypothetical protein HXY41_05250 [Chloroflexi bacterium]|nr:hypothetical protein [Chloroflexota bacterium]